MMKNILIIILAMTMLFSFSTATAVESENSPHRNSENVLDRINICTNCNRYCVTECIGERVILNSGFHTASDGTQCLAVGYGSRYADICPECRRVVYVTSALHDCYLEHRDCGKGRQDTHGI